MFPNKKVMFFVLCCVVPAIFTVTAAAAVNEIIGVRHWVAPDHTRFVIDTSQEADFRVEKEKGDIAVIIKNAILPARLGGVMLLKKPGLHSVCFSSRPQSEVRIDFDLAGSLQTNVFKLKKFRDKPDRIVVDIDLVQPERNDKRGKEEAVAKGKKRVVVIDPGHGGDDPGAVGKKGTYEKDIVLRISKKISDILNRTEGYRAYLTRSGDYYVPFKKRIAIARKKGADLFLSIHADASRNINARGCSVYCLAAGAASSEAARILANNENLADVIGGVPVGEQSDASDPIILNMLQTHVRNQSRSFGHTLLERMKSVNDVKFDDVQEAPFFVLKLPEIPSILLETAFLSNPKEEKLLKKDEFQKKVAVAVADSIVSFFPPFPEEGGKKGGPPPEMMTYTVKGGDTLYSIAASYGTTAGVLRDLNNLKRPERLYVGSRLLIPRKEN